MICSLFKKSNNMRRKIIYLCVLLSVTLIPWAKAQNVGIGTTIPTEKLDVNGAIKIGTTGSGSKGTIRYRDADSSVEAYAGTGWKSVINYFDVVGLAANGSVPVFTSMTRGQAVVLPNLTYTVKKSGYYLVLLSADGTGVQERNNIFNFQDNREDQEGEIKLRNNGSGILTKRFFHISPDAADAAQDTPWRYHSDDGEKSTIQYLAAGDVIQTVGTVYQAVGAAAPAQQNPWSVYVQVKFILLR